MYSNTSHRFNAGIFFAEIKLLGDVQKYATPKIHDFDPIPAISLYLDP